MPFMRHAERRSSKAALYRRHASLTWLCKRLGLNCCRIRAVLERATHSGLLALPLRVDVALDGRVADVAHGCGEVRPGPQRGQATPQMRKRLPQRVRGEPLELVGRGTPRVALDEQVHVVG